MRYSKLIGLAMSTILVVGPLQECTTPPTPGPTTPTTTAPTTDTTAPPTTAPPTIPPTTDCTTVPTTDNSLIPNGDFNQNYVDTNNPGTPGTNPRTAYAPPPWRANDTPDYSTDTTISFDTSRAPRANLAGFNSSPAGGSFMGFRSRVPGAAEEGVYNTLQIDDPNEEITIFFHYTEYTNAAFTPGAPNPGVNIQFRLGSFPRTQRVQNVPNLSASGGTPGTWEERRITFTPADIGFTTAGNYDFYLGSRNSVRDTWAFVDGLVVNKTRELCPPPTTAPPTTAPPTTAPPTIPPTTDCASVPTTDNSLIPNGDFNENYVDTNNPGTPGTNARRAFAPAPWGINATPDYSTDTNISFNADGGTPRANLTGFNSSPAGGSFMGFRSIATGNNEGLYNTLQIDDPNEEITIFFQYTEYDLTLATQIANPDVNIQFRLGIDPTATPVDTTGTVIQNVPNFATTGSTNGTWEPRRITFTPADIGFTTAGNYNFYLGAKDSALNAWAFVDGLVVNTTEDLCPPEEPTPTIPPTTDCTSAPTTDNSLIPNGDFNENYVDTNNPGTPGTNPQAEYAPPPWGINSTPDYSTDTLISFAGGGTPRANLAGFQPSPAGGSFMGFRSLVAGTFEEGIYNTLQIDDPNEEITIFFYYTEWHALLGRAVDPDVNIQFRLGVDPTARRVDTTGTVIQNVPNLTASGGTAGTWEERRITFTPADLGFTTAGNYNFYLGAKDGVPYTWGFVDGLVVNKTRELCEPEPTPPPTTAPPTTQPT